MTLSLAVDELVRSVERTPVDGAPRLRLAKTSEGLEGKLADRRFAIRFQASDDLDTNIDGRVSHVLALVLQRVPGGDLVKDQLGLVADATAVRSQLRSTAYQHGAFLVRGTTYQLLEADDGEPLYIAVIVLEHVANG